MATPPTSFGKYRILERVAVGSLAEIYKARLDGIGGFHRTFAIKRILPHLAKNGELVELLIEEARVAGLLSHANIVQIMDLGEVEGSTFIAMEYVDGPDLGKVLAACRERGITLPVPHAIFIAIEMLKGLEYAHQRQVMKGGRLVPLDVVHRDVSPGNVLLSRQGEVKLTDFGVDRSHLATVGAGPRSRSPEQAAGGAVDHRTDLFGTGEVLYEMLTGQRPFGADPALAALQSGEHEPASSVNPDVPYGLERIIERALLPDPADRYASATAMKDALDAFFHEAGFIFTHSTLAAFLKGLEQVPTRPTLHPGPFDDEGEGEGPGTLEELGILGDEEHSETRPIPELSFDDDEVSEARPTRLADDHLDPGPPPAADDLGEELQLDESEEVPRAVARAPHLGRDAAPPPRSPPPVPPPLPAPVADPARADLSRVETSIRAVPAASAPRRGIIDGLQDMSQSVALGQIAGLGDEATLIRNSPIPGSPTDWSNAATNIRVDPTRPVGDGESIDDGILLPDPDDWDDAETRIRAAPEEVRRTAVLEAPPTRVMSPPTVAVPPPAAAPRPAPSSGLQQLVYLLVGAAVTVAVLFVGFVLGMRASSVIDDSPAGPEGTPRLTVEAPIGKRVTINEQAIEGPGPHLLAPGVHMVRLLDGEDELSKSRLELRPGEHRILSYQLRTVEVAADE